MKPRARPSLVAAPEWRALQKQGTLAALSRFAPIQREGDGLAFVASTAAPDRYGDTIDQTGWDTASYEANPVLLWAHSYSTPPVGKVGALDKTGDLTARGIEFTPPEAHPFGAQVGEMVKAGFLSTVSVGFLPLEWEQRVDPDGRVLGYHFKRMELLEISVVPVPANPQALVEGRAFAARLAEWAAQEGDAGPLTQDFREQTRALLKAADDIGAKAERDAEDDSFSQMLALLERIAASSEAQAEHLAEVRRALAGGASLAREAPVPDAAPQLTLSAAVRHLIRR